MSTNFQIEKMEFILKGDAAELAMEEVGIKFKKENFSSRILLSSKMEMNTKLIQKKSSKIVEEIRSSDPQAISVILRIKT